MGDARPRRQTPVDYAEKTLEVHEVFQQAIEASSSYATDIERHVGIVNSIRAVRDEIEMLEYDIAESVRVDEPNISQAALDRAVKDAKWTHNDLAGFYQKLRSLQTQADSLEASADISKQRLRVLTARMDELAGLLQFYAAAKIVGSGKAVPSAPTEPQREVGSD